MIILEYLWWHDHTRSLNNNPMSNQWSYWIIFTYIMAIYSSNPRRKLILTYTCVTKYSCIIEIAWTQWGESWQKSEESRCYMMVILQCPQGGTLWSCLLIEVSNEFTELITRLRYWHDSYLFHNALWTFGVKDDATYRLETPATLLELFIFRLVNRLETRIVWR